MRNPKSKQLSQNEGSRLTQAPRSLFTLPKNGSSLKLESYQFEDESSDQDLLLNVPSNGSFPQAEAELFCPASSFVSQQASVSSSSIYLSHLRPWQVPIKCFDLQCTMTSKSTEQIFFGCCLIVLYDPPSPTPNMRILNMDWQGEYVGCYFCIGWWWKHVAYVAIMQKR